MTSTEPRRSASPITEVTTRTGAIAAKSAKPLGGANEAFEFVAAPAIVALLGGKPARLIVGLPHGGHLPGLDPEVVIEAWTQVDAAGARPETFDGNARCRADILRFGASRGLAYAAIRSPEPLTLTQYAGSDPFAPPPGAWHEWLRGLEPRTEGRRE